MPRLSLYRSNRQNDYRFMDRTISEMYQVGGVDIYLHKYLGPKTNATGTGDATQPAITTTDPLLIEDLFLLENRDRDYDENIYVMRGVYNIRDIDFDLTQFGLFLNNDTLFITFHLNDMIASVGRKLMNGDVLELPNLKDYHPLDTSLTTALPKYYVVQDASNAAEGFSQTWFPHLWRVKATPLVGAQEYNDILNKPVTQTNNIWDNGNFYPSGSLVLDGDNYYQAIIDVPVGTPITDTTYWAPYTPSSVLDLITTRAKDLANNDATLQQAVAEVPLSGYDNTKFYIVPAEAYENQGAPIDATQVITPTGFGYVQGYLTGDGSAPNGYPVTPGVAFPPAPVTGEYVLRLDYYPNRLFRYDGARWVKVTDNVRTTVTPSAENESLRSNFVNNTNTVTTTDRGDIPSRQSLSDILKPTADN